MSKILFLIGALGRGGMERQMVILMEGLVRRGHTVKLATFLPIDDAYSYDNKIEHLKFDASNKFKTFLNVFNYLHSDRADFHVVIAFGRLSCEVGVLANLGTRIRFIAGERNFSLRESLRGKIDIGLFRFADAVVSNSYSQKDYLTRNYPFLKNKVECITNYTDTNLFRPLPDSTRKDDKEVIIGVFARLHPQKNCIAFLAAVKQAACKAGVGKIRVRWYGGVTSEQEREYCQEVKNYISAQKLNDVVAIIKPTNKVAEAISECDAICLPSLFEGFSNSISEAICCGKPVLASNVSDNHIMVEHSYNGFLFNPNDIDDMTNKLLAFLELPLSERVLMGKKSREKAEKLFDLGQFLDRYETIIEAVQK